MKSLAKMRTERLPEIISKRVAYEEGAHINNFCCTCFSWLLSLAKLHTRTLSLSVVAAVAPWPGSRPKDSAPAAGNMSHCWLIARTSRGLALTQSPPSLGEMRNYESPPPCCSTAARTSTRRDLGRHARRGMRLADPSQACEVRDSSPCQDRGIRWNALSAELIASDTQLHINTFT